MLNCYLNENESMLRCSEGGERCGWEEREDRLGGGRCRAGEVERNDRTCDRTHGRRRRGARTGAVRDRRNERENIPAMSDIGWLESEMVGTTRRKSCVCVCV